VITIIAAILTVVVLAAYLIRVALMLQRVNGKLGAVIADVRTVGKQTEPLGSILGGINHDLTGVDKTLQGVLAKQR